MLEAMNNLMMSLMDMLMGWMLYLPKDVALGIVAVATAAILTLVRPFTTNQDLLRRCKADKQKLKGLIQQAKVKKDKEAVGRYRATVAAIGMKAMKAEGKPLLIAIIPIALLAVWCFGRLGFEAPTPEEPVKVMAYFPQSSIDGVAHITPVDDVEAKTGWVQKITQDPAPGPGGAVNGWASWELAAKASEKPYMLALRHQGKTYEKELLVNGRAYSPTLEFYDESGAGVQAIQLDLPTYKPFGFVPKIEIPQSWVEKTGGVLALFSWFVLDAWLVGYLLIAVPFVFVRRWALKIL